MIRKRTSGTIINRRKRPLLWKNCTSIQTLKQIHASFIVTGFNANISALRELVFASAVAIPGTIDYAHQLFDRISERDTFMWNTMIRGSAQSLNPSKAVFYYSQMEKSHVKPDEYTYPPALKACTKLGLVKMGYCIHGRVLKLGFGMNIFLRNTLIYFHANCGDLGIARKLFDGFAKRDVVAWSALSAGYARRGYLGIARELFDRMPVKDLVSWNVMITWYAKQGQMNEARRLFNEVPQRDVVTWNAMIAGYALSGNNEEALKMFEEMRKVGEMPDEVTMLSLVSACAELGNLDVGVKMHNMVLEMGSEYSSVLLGNALIDMYAKCGSIDMGLEVFWQMKEKDLTTWNSLICGLAFHGHAGKSIDLFREMERLKVRPNEITMVGLLSACSHAGIVKEGQRFFNLMRVKYNVEPNIRHYGCMVDMLGRAGLLNEAFDFIQKMEIAPNAIIWRALLGACRIHGNVELGNYANEKLLSMRHYESGDYVLLSNIYALHGEWGGVEKVRKLMDDGGIRKNVAIARSEQMIELSYATY